MVTSRPGTSTYDHKGMSHLVLVEEEASGLAGGVDDEREPVTEPLQHNRVLQAQVVRRKPHSLWRKKPKNTPITKENLHQTQQEGGLRSRRGRRIAEIL